MEREELVHGHWYEIHDYPLPNFPGVVFQLDLCYGDDPVIYFVYYPAPGRTLSEHVVLSDLAPYLREVEQPDNRTGFNPKETILQQQKRAAKQRKKIAKWIEGQGKELL